MRAIDVDLDAHPGHVPGQPAMWAFALFELFLFSTYFAVYFVNRTQHPDLFLSSQEELELPLATINTIVLLTSSWTMARCIDAARGGRFRAATTNAWATVALAAVFVGSKVLGWVTLRGDGFGVTENLFFNHYYFLTGLHMLHVVIGFVALAVLLDQLRSTERRSLEVIETCGVYWHTVDLIWVLVFSVLYVVR